MIFFPFYRTLSILWVQFSRLYDMSPSLFQETSSCRRSFRLRAVLVMEL